jgi:uncharacterized protein YeaO (DUF488 family)
MTIKLKRAYDAPSRDDGERYLVERLWPRGVSKERAALRDWLKELAPSTDLRNWYQHDLNRWPEFERRYREELRDRARQDDLQRLVARARTGDITLVFAARDAEHSSARVLKDVLEALLANRRT